MTDFTGHQFRTDTEDGHDELRAHSAHPINIQGGWSREDISHVKWLLAGIVAFLAAIALILGVRDNGMPATDAHNVSSGSSTNSATVRPTQPVNPTLYNVIVRSGMLDGLTDGALKPGYPLVESNTVSYAWQNGSWVDVFVNPDPTTAWQQYNMLYQRAAASQPLDLTKDGSYLHANLPGVAWAFWTTSPAAYGEQLTTGTLTVMTDQDVLLVIKLHAAGVTLGQVNGMVDAALAASLWSSVTAWQ